MEKIVSQRSRSRRWLVNYPRAAPLGIFLLVAAITALSVFAIERVVDSRSDVLLRERASTIAAAIERRAAANSSYLRAGAALLSTLDEVTADSFRRFVDELRLEADYRGAEGIGWAPLVAPDAIAAYNADVAARLPGDVVLHPPFRPPQPFAAPVTFLLPDTVRNRRALGYDMYSEAVRRSAMIEAEQTAQPTASGKVVLAQEGTGSEPGFLIYMPVFDSDTDARTLKGFIYSPINAEDFLASALELEAAGDIGIEIYDGAYEPTLLLASLNSPEARGPITQQAVTIANHSWLLRVQGVEGNVLSTLSMMTLIFGLLVACLLALLARMLTQQAIEDGHTLSWLEEQASIRNSLTRELNHRVKNTLANVLSIIALTRRRADTIEEFAAGLDGRIRALSATHDLLTQSDWGTTPIRAVVEAELAPYANTDEHVVDLAGPPVELAPGDALSLGLAIHELATNAAKFGALSQRGGEVRVRWDMVNERLARIHWAEAGGPPVSEERKRGFGLDLIEKIVAHELKNPVDLRFEKEGVRCTLTIPVRQPVTFEIRARPASLRLPGA